MKLPKLNRLLAALAINMSPKHLSDLLATSTFTVREKESTESLISFFNLLLRKEGTVKSFLVEVERLFSVCSCAYMLSVVKDFKKSNPDLLSVSGSPDHPEYKAPKIKPQKKQITSFQHVLFDISQDIDENELKIMVVASPIPESNKEGISKGYVLFDQMKRYGCIDENDTELLEEMLRLFPLSKALDRLLEYRREYPCKSTAASPHQCELTNSPHDKSQCFSHRCPVEPVGQDASQPATYNIYAYVIPSVHGSLQQQQHKREESDADALIQIPSCSQNIQHSTTSDSHPILPCVHFNISYNLTPTVVRTDPLAGRKRAHDDLNYGHDDRDESPPTKRACSSAADTI